VTVASVEKRVGKTGTFYDARWRDPAGRAKKKAFRRRVDADRYLTTVGAGMLDGSYVDPLRSRMTVGAFAGPWIAGRAHLKPKTLSSYRSLLRTRVLPRWADVPLAKVSHADVVAWVAAMRAEGLSASRTRQAYHVLTAMLDDAVNDRRLSRNPAAGVDLPRLRKTERRYLTHEQVHALADAAGPHRLLVLVLAYCGLRWGEAAGLRKRRIELLRGRLEIVEAVVDVDGQMIFGPPKTHQHRSVAIPKFLRDDLAAQLAGKSPDDLVFPSRTGSPLRVQSFRRGAFDAAAREIGELGLVPHELRHTAASLAISAGASVKAVQAMLGHASAAMTLDLYGHLFGDELDAVADRLDAARAQHVPKSCPDPAVIPIAERKLGR
jgi:integrase